MLHVEVLERVSILATTVPSRGLAAIRIVPSKVLAAIRTAVNVLAAIRTEPTMMAGIRNVDLHS